MEISRDLPRLSDFTPLSDFQSQTPTSFHSGPPVLYHHTPRATLKFSSSDAASSTAFSSFAHDQSSPSGIQAPTNGINGNFLAHSAEPDLEDVEQDETQANEVELHNISIWVTSTHFILTRPSSSARPTSTTSTSPPPPPTLKIPYPSISLHARSSPPPSLYLQLLTTTGPVYDDYDPDITIALTIIPSPAPSTSTSTSTTTPAEEEIEAQNLYTALSACADLHPDPPAADYGDDNDDAFWTQEDDPLGLDQIDERGVGYIARGPHGSTTDGGHEEEEEEDDASGDGGGATAAAAAAALPPPMPGSGGWITAENVGEFFDEDGSLREGVEMGGRLGDGGGRVRGRDEEEEVGDGDGRNGHGREGNGMGEGDETKWRRTA